VAASMGGREADAKGFGGAGQRTPA